MDEGGGCVHFFYFKQKTAYEMRISDWSSDVGSSDLLPVRGDGQHAVADGRIVDAVGIRLEFVVAPAVAAEVMTPFRRIRTAGVVELVLPGRRALECPGVIAGARRSIRGIAVLPSRSEEHTSELQSLMPTSYAVFFLN